MPVAGNTVFASDIPIRGGVQLRRAANQSVANITVTPVSWDTQDEDIGGFWTSGTTVTVPAGYDGIYAITFRCVGGMIAATRNFAEIIVTSSITGITGEYRFPSSSPAAGEGRMVAVYSGPLAAADSFVCNIYQSTGSAQNNTALVVCYKLGD
jgi:hypothetical protein